MARDLVDELDGSEGHRARLVQRFVDVLEDSRRRFLAVAIELRSPER